jgi:hypothetical protein
MGMGGKVIGGAFVFLVRGSEEGDEVGGALMMPECEGGAVLGLDGKLCPHVIARIESLNNTVEAAQ